MDDKNREIKVMGIINLTGNSYFAESRCLDSRGNCDIDKVLRRAGQMMEEGADILDIGACSTRPGSEAVGEAEEWRRIEPALKAVRREFPEAALSVDTYWPSVVRNTYNTVGQFIVNDVTAGRGMLSGADGGCIGTEGGCMEASGNDPGEMLLTVGHLRLPYVAMHIRGNPGTMQQLTDYDDITADVLKYFHEFDMWAKAAGVHDWILDPGFGFAKTILQNYRLLGNLGRFRETGHRVLVGVSRKSMIYKKFNITPEESLPATQVLHYKALCEGADILRVHDVAEAVRTVSLYRTLENASNGV